MKTVEDCAAKVESGTEVSPEARAGKVIGFGLCAVAYALRDLAIAVKQLQEARESKER